MSIADIRRFVASPGQRRAQRSALALVLACGGSLVATLVAVHHWNAKATASLNSAAQRLDALTIHPADDAERAAISWGYAERLRLGLESPFRLIDEASRDSRLDADERRTVSWALLAHVVRGETYAVEPAALDGLGPVQSGASVTGEQHVALMARAISAADNPRAAELAIRVAYTLAATERLVDASAPVLVAEVAAMLADREIARREAHNVVQAARGADPIDVVRSRRRRRAFYTERPVLLAPTRDIEDAAVVLARPLLDSLRAMRPGPLVASQRTPDIAAALPPALFAAGQRVPPTASLAVTVQRHLPTLRAQTTHVDMNALARVRNAEMLVAAAARTDTGRSERRAIGRLMIASSVAMRSLAQEPVWFPTDTAIDAATTAAALGIADIAFDRDVPAGWRPYSIRSLANAITDLRRIFPALDLSAVHVLFRMNAPADSALAMHDPRTRTLHLPVMTWAGTLSHELGHDLDRQSAEQLGIAGYRSDIVARAAGSDPRAGGGAGNERLAASLRALTEELSQTPNVARTITERPAEIFATRVDWFVAQALARQGISDGFLSAVQDELLTGHVVHPERLQGSARSRSLLTALEEMTTVSAFAREEQEPSVQTLLRWSLAVPVDRRVAADILQGDAPWMPTRLLGDRPCRELDARATLVRMAAESRARGWLRLRARWTPDNQRTSLAHAALGQAPWSSAPVDNRVAALRDYVLLELESGMELPAGLGAFAAQLANRARCSNGS